jgi:hypothetical protein
MQEETQMSLISLSQMFTKLCLNVINPNTMLVLKVKFVETMFTLKKVFLLACFDVMTHVKGIC